MGGTFSYSQNKNNRQLSPTQTFEYDKSSTLELLPEVGFFISSKLSVGMRIGSQRKKSSALSAVYNAAPLYSTFEEPQFLIGPVVRGYFKLGDRFYVGPELSVIFGSGDREYSSPTFNPPLFIPFYQITKYDISSFGVSLVPRISYYPTPFLAIEASFGTLSYYTNEVQRADKALPKYTESSDIQLSLNPSTFRLGVIFLFGSMKK